VGVGALVSATIALQPVTGCSNRAEDLSLPWQVPADFFQRRPAGDVDLARHQVSRMKPERKHVHATRPFDRDSSNAEHSWHSTLVLSLSDESSLAGLRLAAGDGGFGAPAQAIAPEAW
jgi:hypothetical protein